MKPAKPTAKPIAHRDIILAPSGPNMRKQYLRECKKLQARDRALLAEAQRTTRQTERAINTTHRSALRQMNAFTKQLKQLKAATAATVTRLDRSHQARQRAIAKERTAIATRIAILEGRLS